MEKLSLGSVSGEEKERGGGEINRKTGVQEKYGVKSVFGETKRGRGVRGRRGEEKSKGIWGGS